MATVHWARLATEGAYPLRRGAWYRVVKLAPSEVIVEVNRKRVTIPRPALEFVEGRPPRLWTVVPRPAKAVGLPESWGAAYGVCPSCRHRTALFGSPDKLRCPRCNNTFLVAWEEHYLGRE